MKFKNGTSIDYDLTGKKPGDRVNAKVYDANNKVIGYEHGLLSEDGTIQGNIEGVKKWSKAPSETNSAKTNGDAGTKSSNDKDTKTNPAPSSTDNTSSKTATYENVEEVAKKNGGKATYGQRSIPGGPTIDDSTHVTLTLKNGYSIDYHLAGKEEKGTVYDDKGNSVGETTAKFSKDGKVQGDIGDIEKWSKEPSKKSIEKDIEKIDPKNPSPAYLKQVVEEHKGDKAYLKALFDKLGPTKSMEVINSACKDKNNKINQATYSGGDKSKATQDGTADILLDGYLTAYGQSKTSADMKDKSGNFKLDQVQGATLDAYLSESDKLDETQLAELTKMFSDCPSLATEERMTKLIAGAMKSDGKLTNGEQEMLGSMMKSYMLNSNLPKNGIDNFIKKMDDELKKSTGKDTLSPKEFGQITGLFYSGAAKLIKEDSSKAGDLKDFLTTAVYVGGGVAGVATSETGIGPVLCAVLTPIAATLVGRAVDGGKKSNDMLYEVKTKVDSWSVDPEEYGFKNKEEAREAQDTFKVACDNNKVDY